MPFPALLPGFLHLTMPVLWPGSSHYLLMVALTIVQFACFVTEWILLAVSGVPTFRSVRDFEEVRVAAVFLFEVLLIRCKQELSRLDSSKSWRVSSVNREFTLSERFIE